MGKYGMTCVLFTNLLLVTTTCASPCHNGFLQVLQEATTHLDCSGIPINGTLPSELGTVTEIITLKLQGANLVGTIPTELGDLAQLKVLDLSGNHLTGTIPSELHKLSNLQKINLSGNNLVGVIPTELGQLSSLHVMDLSSNQLGCSIPHELASLQQLDELYLSRNNLTGKVPKELRDRTFLPEPAKLLLYVTDNRIASEEQYFADVWEECNPAGSRSLLCTSGDEYCQEGICIPTNECWVPRGGQTLNGTVAPTSAPSEPSSDVPIEWTCDDTFYGGSDGCDCGICGPVRDPDCASAKQPLVGCNKHSIGCGSQGECLYRPVPDEWSCQPWQFDEGDACHCGCGVPDPDCQKSTVTTLLGCDEEREAMLEQFGVDTTAKMTCNVSGNCAVETKAPTSSPTNYPTASPSSTPTHSPTISPSTGILNPAVSTLVFDRVEFEFSKYNTDEFRSFLQTTIAAVKGISVTQVTILSLVSTSKESGSANGIRALFTVEDVQGNLVRLDDNEIAEILHLAVTLDASRTEPSRYGIGARNVSRGGIEWYVVGAVVATLLGTVSGIVAFRVKEKTRKDAEQRVLSYRQRARSSLSSLSSMA